MPIRVKNLKPFLKALNITQGELAEALGLRPTTISELLGNRRSTINKEHLSRVATYLGIPEVSELIEFTPDADVESAKRKPL